MKFTVQGHKLNKRLSPRCKTIQYFSPLYNTSPNTSTAHHWTPIYNTSFYPVYHVQLSTTKKITDLAGRLKKNNNNKKKNTQFVETEQATRTRFKHGRVVEIISLGIYGNDDEYVKDTNVEGCFLIIWKFTNWIGNLGCSWSVTSLSHVHGNLIVLYIDHCEFLTELGPKNPNHCAEKERS